LVTGHGPRFVSIGDASGLAEGALKLVEVEGRDLVVVRIEGEVYALDNRCPHLGGPLSGGRVEGRAVVCPWHGWQWDAKTGRAVWPQVDWRAFTYPTRIEAGQILVRVA